ncbi:winged helix-turn-helix domain-containing protein [Bacillus sp. BP-3]|uniref:winged helix-turn-helix domain-containing protein n=1 Tax=Bacillus sp. BP-3 TaxID=3022773 RepID=UPI00232B4BF1|nr:winged helix-turn-helix domain-containing protein [Bacillus sp. BP-3]MDC2866467.1 winged helix-turn-helix domain-containing protein [Bacillus sp. BP-3]
MSYRVAVDDSIVYELLLSFLLYKRRKNLKYLYKGMNWVEEVDSKITDEYKNKLDQFEDVSFGDVLCLIIEGCPQKENIHSFLNWFQKASITTLYELLAPHLKKEDSHFLLGLENQKNNYFYFLSEWYNQYFKFENIEKKIANEASKFSEKAETYSPEKLVEVFATGLKIEIPTIKHVVLIPSLHFCPLHTFSIFKEKMFVWYPVSFEESREKIFNISKALADQKRLDILQFLSRDKYKFTDILSYIGGAKGNLHHHLMILRSANLIRVHLSSNNQFYLSTRTEFATELKEKMIDFIQNTDA